MPLDGGVGISAAVAIGAKFIERSKFTARHDGIYDKEAEKRVKLADRFDRIPKEDVDHFELDEYNWLHSKTLEDLLNYKNVQDEYKSMEWYEQFFQKYRTRGRVRKAKRQVQSSIVKEGLHIEDLEAYSRSNSSRCSSVGSVIGGSESGLDLGRSRPYRTDSCSVRASGGSPPSASLDDINNDENREKVTAQVSDWLSSMEQEPSDDVPDQSNLSPLFGNDVPVRPSDADFESPIQMIKSLHASQDPDDEPKSDDINDHSAMNSDKKGKRTPLDDLKRFLNQHLPNSKKEPPRTATNQASLGIDAQPQLVGMHMHDSSWSENRNKPFNEYYSKWRKVGSNRRVQLIKRKTDGAVLCALKKYEPRRKEQPEKEYQKKIVAEFCISSTLKHPNVIHTFDLMTDHGSFYEVTEYLPYDLFSVVMTGKMTRSEIYCIFRQICDGVRYLHSTGVAHLDLKLDNCRIADTNVVKISDFSTATVFRYPGLGALQLSDSYEAPKADVWSVGIIFLCMILRRFPWKIAENSDISFQTFVKAHPDQSTIPIPERSTSPLEETILQYSVSVDTLQTGGASSIFNLLPRETRRTLKRMIVIDPLTRCTLEELLQSQESETGNTTRSQNRRIKRMSVGSSTGTPSIIDKSSEPLAENDDWLRSILPCCRPGVEPNHVHVTVKVEEKQEKRFFS
ncbi:kinase-like domain-containing protein, partial [Gymnopilus junonius]